MSSFLDSDLPAETVKAEDVVARELHWVFVHAQTYTAVHFIVQLLVGVLRYQVGGHEFFKIEVFLISKFNDGLNACL